MNSIDRVTQSVMCKKETVGVRLVLGAAAYVGSALDDFLGGLILVLLEVLHEELAELLDFALEVGGTVP